ncbi:MAG: aminotransferase class V-fold PLP-dependent enzyme, partial [Firmicutes bacterium]|nr:aminotransferase class V-fold PLP-dependent enzyme [Bacillota bacterium]
MIQTRQLHRVDNFGAGPSALPLQVLERAQEELLDFAGSGMSMLELSHRDRRYEAVYQKAVQRLRELLALSASQHVLFLQGGASLQFAMVPMNLLTPERCTAAYAISGAWGAKAYQDAQAIGDVRVIASSQSTGFDRVPPLSTDALRPSDAYLHITSNETIGGVQWPTLPADMPVPVVVDMSSDILSRELDLTGLGLIYAGAQKNLGPSG